MKKAKNKKGQVMIELVMVLGVYLFLLGFMITGFQVMHNKIVYSLAAYEGVRTAIAYDPVTGGHNISLAQERANSVLATQIGTTKGDVKIDITTEGDYFKCTVTGNNKFLFPILNPNGIGSKNEHVIATSFTMRKERPSTVDD